MLKPVGYGGASLQLPFTLHGRPINAPEMTLSVLLKRSSKMEACCDSVSNTSLNDPFRASGLRVKDHIVLTNAASPSFQPF